MLKKSIMVTILLCCISACDPTVKKYLGVDDKAPDEYGVIKQRPLSMPPDFSLLPPEQAGKRKEATVGAKDDSSLTASDDRFLNKAQKSLTKNQKIKTDSKEQE